MSECGYNGLTMGYEPTLRRREGGETGGSAWGAAVMLPERHDVRSPDGNCDGRSPPSPFPTTYRDNFFVLALGISAEKFNRFVCSAVKT